MTGSTDLTPQPGKLELIVSPATLVVTRGAETWQFFAFVFAALVTLALALLDEMPDRLQPWRITFKVAAFIGLAYLTLGNARIRDRLARLLNTFKEERR